MARWYPPPPPSWSNKWQHIPVFLPGKFHGQRSLADTIYQLHKQCTYVNPKLLIYPSRHHFSPFSSLQFSSVAQSCPTLCNPMNRSTPGLPVHHQLPEFTQTHVHRVDDAIQPSHPLSSPSSPAFNLSQH